MLLKVNPVETFSGTFQAPASKPETQRAILAASLAAGKSVVRNDLRCLETRYMRDALRSAGATFEEVGRNLEVTGGIGASPIREVINAHGSGLVFRTITALASAWGQPVILSGDAVLRKRVMNDLFLALRQLGAEIDCISEIGQAPVVNWGTRLRGGHCELPGDVSSQFVTAILFAAPFGERATTLRVLGDVYSKSYIEQTIACLRRSGISVDHSDDFKEYQVSPGSFSPQEYDVGEDYTSLSYILAASAILPGSVTIKGVHGGSLQGERQIVDLVRDLGISVEHHVASKELFIRNDIGRPKGRFEVNALDFPNIVPTLCAIGAYIDGSLTVTGARITRLHKAPRVRAMTTELQKLEVNIQSLEVDGIVDGFKVFGKASYPGGCVLESWGDHRIFMSLFVAAQRCELPSWLEGYGDTNLSFPGFIDAFRACGSVAEIVDMVPGDIEIDSREVV